MANKRVRTNPSYLEFTASSGGQTYTITGRGVVVDETLVAAIVAAGTAVGVGVAVEDSPLPVTPPASALTPEQLASVAATLSATIAPMIDRSLLVGDERVRSMLDAAVMSSPPTITRGSGVGIGALAPKGVYGERAEWPGYRYSGAPMYASYPGETAGPYRCYTGQPTHEYAGGWSWRVEFDHDGEFFAFRLDDNADITFRVWANERPHSATMVAANTITLDGTTSSAVKVNFGSRAYRRIVLEFKADTAYFFDGIYVNATTTVAPPTIRSPRFMVIGDSYGYGGGSSNQAFAYPIQLGRALGYADTWNQTCVSSTGFIANNPTSKYRNRLATDVYPHSPDVILLQGSINDRFLPTNWPANAGLVGPEFAYVVAQIRANLPNAVLIATSPLVAGTPSADALALRDELQAAAATAEVPFIDVLDRDVSLFFGTGYGEAPTGNGNADFYAQGGGGDASHPTDSGHKVLARFLAARIRPLLLNESR